MSVVCPASLPARQMSRVIRVRLHAATLLACCFASVADGLQAKTAAGRPVAMAANKSILVLVGGATVTSIPHKALGRLTESPPAFEPITVVGKNLVDITRVDEETFVAADATTNELIGLRVSGTKITPTIRYSSDVTPAEVRVGLDNTSLCVSGTWDRAVQIIYLEDFFDSKQSSFIIPLSFEPKSILPLPGGRFLVADAFGGYLALVDGDQRRVLSIKSLRAHHIGDMILSNDQRNVSIPHQTLSRIARTDRDDIHWGSLVGNVVSTIPIEALGQNEKTQRTEEMLQRFRSSIRTKQIGNPGNGFADPVSIAVEGDRQAVLSMGAQQLLITTDSGAKHRVKTGRRPNQLLSLPDERLVVLNEQDGNIMIVRWDFPERQTTLSIADRVPLSTGEAAFYDASLSHDGWLSCNSCHIEGHTPSLLVDTKGDESYGTPKRIPSLLRGTDTAPFGWIGNRHDLPSQIEATLHSTMHARSIPAGTSEAIAEYLRTLKPPQAAPHSEIPTHEATSIARGKELFESLQCGTCHTPPSFTSGQTKNVGLKDESGHDLFNPPSLRGIHFRRVFFHDGRADSLRQVFKVYKHQLPRKLTAAESSWLTSYLNSL